jgi:hypothetical protein
MTATRTRPGAASFSRPSHLPPIENSYLLKPVMLPETGDVAARLPHSDWRLTSRRCNMWRIPFIVAHSVVGDFIEDQNTILPIDAAIQSNLRETTARALASLTRGAHCSHALWDRREH